MTTNNEQPSFKLSLTSEKQLNLVPANNFNARLSSTQDQQTDKHQISNQLRRGQIKPNKKRIVTMQTKGIKRKIGRN